MAGHVLVVDSEALAGCVLCAEITIGLAGKGIAIDFVLLVQNNV